MFVPTLGAPFSPSGRANQVFSAQHVALPTTWTVTGNRRNIEAMTLDSTQLTTPLDSAKPAGPAAGALPHRRLGRSGLAVSVVGLGCNNLGRPHTPTESFTGTQLVIDTALEAGITLFDVADNYGANPGLSEEFLGKALGGRRDQVTIATKFGMDNGGISGPDFGARGSRRYIIAAVEGSLRRLGTDYIDLFQHHTPDPATPIEETLSALDHLVTSGKVRYLGHSNRAGWQVAQAEYVARELGTARFISTQNNYNLIDRRAELEVVPAAAELGLGLLPYFPLANGLLTGKYTSTHAPKDGRVTHTKPEMLKSAPWAKLEDLAVFGRERDLTMIEIAFSWLAAQPVVGSVIAGATRPEQVAQNSAAVRPLSPADLAAINAIFGPPTKVALF